MYLSKANQNHSLGLFWEWKKRPSFSGPRVGTSMKWSSTVAVYPSSGDSQRSDEGMNEISYESS